MEKTKLCRDNAAVVVDASLVRRALEFAAVQDVRFYLMGVCIRPSEAGGVLVIASDGHTLIVLHDKAGRAKQETILPLRKRDHARVLAPKVAFNVCVSGDGTVFTTDLIGRATYIGTEPLIDGKFPDVKGMLGDIAEFEPGLPGSYNPAYLQRALAADVADRRYSGIGFYHRRERGQDSPVLFTTTDGFGAIMPLRNDAKLVNLVPRDFTGGQA